jgi:hypothetical protein
MDKYLKLKLEIVYRGFPIEQAQQRFKELKEIPVPVDEVPLVGEEKPKNKPKRKLKK